MTADQAFVGGAVSPQPQPAPVPPPAAFKAEIVQGIPVKAPVDPVVKAKHLPPNSPFAQPARSNSEHSTGDDKELDKILKDVTHSVKKGVDSTEERFGRLTAGDHKPAAVKTPKAEKTNSGSPPVLATVVAVAVAAVLVAAAFTSLKAS